MDHSEHNSGEQPAPDNAGQIQAISEVLLHLQQRLLALGFRYLDGDPGSWPLTAVLLAKEDAYLLISPWPLDVGRLRSVWEHLRRQAPSAGLVLVGAAETEGANYLFDMLEGALAYIDARSGQVSVRAGMNAPDVLSYEFLTALVNQPLDAESAQIDPRAVLHEQLAHRQAAVEIGGGQSAPPYVTYGLMGICILVFLGTTLSGGISGGLGIPEQIVLNWALVPAKVYQGEWWRLFTCAFLHANLIHIGFNMFALYNLGVPLERWQGPVRFAALYLFSLITSSLAALYFTPKADTLGASGAIFGLFGGFIIIALMYGKDFPQEMRKGLFGWIPRMLILNLAISLLPGISLAGHAGGLVGGMLIGAIILRSPVRRNPLPSWAVPALIVLLAATYLLATYILSHPR